MTVEMMVLSDDGDSGKDDDGDFDGGGFQL